MNEEQIRRMLGDTIDNTPAPAGLSHADFKRQWLNAVAAVATVMAKE